MIELLLRRKAEILKYDIRETLEEALRRSTPLDTLFALADARDALDELERTSWNGPRVHALVTDCEHLLNIWHKAA